MACSTSFGIENNLEFVLDLEDIWDKDEEICKEVQEFETELSCMHFFVQSKEEFSVASLPVCFATFCCVF
jgi:hypothetical protein